MKAWEIWSYQPAGWPDAHPAVIVSSPSRVANKPELNVLMCSSQRTTREPTPVEVILDKAEGLNWPTLCKCDLLLSTPECYGRMASKSAGSTVLKQTNSVTRRHKSR